MFGLYFDHLVETDLLETSLSPPSFALSYDASSAQSEVSTHQRTKCYFVAPVLPPATKIVLIQAL